MAPFFCKAPEGAPPRGTAKEPPNKEKNTGKNVGFSLSPFRPRVHFDPIPSTPGGGYQSGHVPYAYIFCQRRWIIRPNTAPGVLKPGENT